MLRGSEEQEIVLEELTSEMRLKGCIGFAYINVLTLGRLPCWCGLLLTKLS